MDADAAAGSITSATPPVTERALTAGGEHVVETTRQLALADTHTGEAAAEQALESTLWSLSPETILKVWGMDGAGGGTPISIRLI